MLILYNYVCVSPLRIRGGPPWRLYHLQGRQIYVNTHSNFTLEISLMQNGSMHGADRLESHMQELLNTNHTCLWLINARTMAELPSLRRNQLVLMMYNAGPYK